MPFQLHRLNGDFSHTFLDGNTDRNERAAILERLRTGETLVVSNCGIVSEGFDLPQLWAAIIARPTASLALHMQMVGRVMRPAAGKVDAVVLDHAGNHLRHGSVERRIAYTLQGKITTLRQGGKGRTIGEAVCPECSALVFGRPEHCPECSAELAHDPEHADGQLVELKPPSFAELADIWAELEIERANRGHLKGWSFHRFEELSGSKPILGDNDELINPKKATMADKRSVHCRLSRVQRQRGYKSGWVAHEFKKVFGVWPRLAKNKANNPQF